MTPYRRLSSVRKVLNNHVSLRSSPPPGARPTDKDILQGPSSVLSTGHKRYTPDTSIDRHSKLSAHVSQGSRRASRTPEIVKGARRQSSSPNTAAFSRIHSSSPYLPFAEPVKTMLNQAEDTRGNETIRLTRGIFASPVPSRFPRRPSSRLTSESATLVKSYARSNKHTASGDNRPRGVPAAR